MAGRRFNRKTAPKVRDGTVQFKNRWEMPANYYNTAQKELVFDRERPGHGYKHLLRLDDVRRFIHLLPMWDELSEGLNAVVLARGEEGAQGWCYPGVVALCAWPRSIELEQVDAGWYREHRALLKKLRVPCTQARGGWRLEFDALTARAFQLIHVLVHELGHHHDRMTTRSQREASRGEPYAERYAVQHEDKILAAYVREFDL